MSWRFGELDFRERYHSGQGQPLLSDLSTTEPIMENENLSNQPIHPDQDAAEGLKINENEEPFVHWLHVVIRFCVRILAVLMTLVIMWSVADVAWVLYQRAIVSPTVGLLSMDDILVSFSAFMVTLIAIEIFLNIVLYLRDDVLHVKLVLATALMAIARKVIVMDYKTLEPTYIWATAAVIFALSIGYWLVAKKTQ